MSWAAGGSLHLGSGSAITSVAFYAGTTSGDAEFNPIVDGDGVAIVKTVAADSVVALPDECFGIGMVKFVCNAAEELEVSLKG